MSMPWFQGLANVRVSPSWRVHVPARLREALEGELQVSWQEPGCWVIQPVAMARHPAGDLNDTVRTTLDVDLGFVIPERLRRHATEVPPFDVCWVGSGECLELWSARDRRRHELAIAEGRHLERTLKGIWMPD